MKVLVTAAGGMTGVAIVRQLRERGLSVRAAIQTPRRRSLLERLGAEVFEGDLRDAGTRRWALRGISAAYLIWPNFDAGERGALGAVIEESSGSVERIVYHSVFRPHVEAMPHHWAKARVEERLFASQCQFTILQPCAYFDNMATQFDRVRAGRGYRCTWAPEARLSLVAISDVAEVAGRVMTERGHDGASYELCGPQALSAYDVCEELSRAAGLPVPVVGRTRADTLAQDTYAEKCFAMMSAYYDAHGLGGSAVVLETLLGRRPASLADYLAAAWPRGSAS